MKKNKKDEKKEMTKKEEEEMAAKKKSNMNDCMSESDIQEDFDSYQEYKATLDRQNFRESFLYQMSFSDMNDHHYYKLLWVTGQCFRSIGYAYALV